MRVRNEVGQELDATFFVESMDRGQTILYQSRSGGRASARARNVDYIPGLELILQRLSDLGAVITDIQVDSARIRRAGLSAARRRLILRDGRRYPVRLTFESDLHELRLAISAAQRDVGRAEGVRHGGGNNTKQIRIFLETLRSSDRDLERILAGV